jgi:hypothetical protein
VILQALLYAALGCAVLSAVVGNRTAWVLLASAAFCLALDQAHVPFHPVYWMMFDLVAAVLIIRRDMSHADCVVLSLFIPAWVFYFMPNEQRYLGSALVAIVQLFLTAPLEKLRFVPTRVRAWFGDSGIYDKMVAHVRLAGV